MTNQRQMTRDQIRDDELTSEGILPDANAEEIVAHDSSGHPLTREDFDGPSDADYDHDAQIG